jgi:hypothetical protein
MRDHRSRQRGALMADGGDDDLEAIDVAPPASAWPPPSAWPPASPPPPSPTPWAPPPPTPNERRTNTGWIAGVVALMLVAGLVAFAITYNARPDSNESAGPPANAGPSPSTLPGRSGAPAALDRISLRQRDVVNGVVVGLITNGDQLTRPTLDLCNGTFPSEAVRTARWQVAAIAANGNTPLSTEAVLYRSVPAGAKAMAEVREVAAECPDEPVVSPVGGPTVTTKFNSAPDTKWGDTPNVDRAAYDLTATNAQGGSIHSVVVYLRRGRVLMGLYFLRPDAPQSFFADKTAIRDIVRVFESRMAGLSSSAVNG